MFDGVFAFFVVLVGWRLWVGRFGCGAGFVISCGLFAWVLGCCFGFRFVARICLRCLFWVCWFDSWLLLLYLVCCLVL